MSEDRGFCDMQMLLQSFKRSEEEETLDILRKLTEHLRKDIQMKEYFYKLNGVSVILNVSIGANISILNNVLDALAAAAEDHEGNKVKLTLERTFILINKILTSTGSIGQTASLRALVLLSYVCAENIHAQELANTSGCVNTMGELFVKLSQDLLSLDDVKEEKAVFTWNILCTAIAAACGEPANQKNQDSLRSVVHEGTNFLNEWIDKSRDNIQEISCLKTLLIMLPYVLCSNKANQDYFARSGGVHTVVSGLVDLEKTNRPDYDVSEICVKLVYLLSVSIVENSQICKLAGFLGVIPVLIRMLKQIHQKDKGIILMCLVNLLSCPENEKIFYQLDVFTGLSSQMNVFTEGSECWKIIEKICNHIKKKLQSHSDRNLLDLISSNNSMIEENVMCSDNFHNSEDIFSHIDLSTGNKNSSSKHLDKDDKKDYKIDEEFYDYADRYLNSKSGRTLFHQNPHVQLSNDYYEKSKYKYKDDASQILPNYYRRSYDTYSLKDDDSVVDYNHRMGYYNRKSGQHDQSKVQQFRKFEDSENSTQSMFYKTSDRAKFSGLLKEYGRKEMYPGTNYQDKFFPKHDNVQMRQSLQPRNSTSELINRARRLYPRNKMTELEEIDTHQRRHYNHDDANNYEEPRWESLRLSEGRNVQENFTMDRELREGYARMSVKGHTEDDFRKDGLKRDWQKISMEKHFRNDYIVDNETRIAKSGESVGRWSRVDYFKSDMRRREFPKTTVERYSKDRDCLDDENNKDYVRKSVEERDRDNYNIGEERRMQYQRKAMERYSQDESGEYRRAATGRYSSDFKDCEMRKKNLRVSIESHSKDDCSVTGSQKSDPKTTGDLKSFQGHRRSKSVGRLSDLEIQSLLKDMELPKSSDQEMLQSSNNKFCNTVLKQRSASPIMPKLVSVKLPHHNDESPEMTQCKESPQSADEHDCNTKSEITFGNSNESSNQSKNEKQNTAALEERPESQIDGNSSPRIVKGKPENLLIPPFSEEEDRHLVQGIQKFGLDFKAILQEFKFHEKRTPHDLYEKWKYCYNF